MDKEVESETFKDPVDCTRMFLAGIGNRGFIKPDAKKFEPVRPVDNLSRLSQGFKTVDLA